MTISQAQRHVERQKKNLEICIAIDSKYTARSMQRLENAKLRLLTAVGEKNV